MSNETNFMQINFIESERARASVCESAASPDTPEPKFNRRENEKSFLSSHHGWILNTFVPNWEGVHSDI